MLTFIYKIVIIVNKYELEELYNKYKEIITK